MLFLTILLFLFFFSNAEKLTFLGGHSFNEMGEFRVKFRQLEADIEELKGKNEAIQKRLVEFEQKLSTSANYTRIVSGQEMIRILAKNNWNQTDSHKELFLFKPNLLKVVCLGAEKVPRTVRAKDRAPKNLEIVYYEVKILSAEQKDFDGDSIGIGFAPKSMPLGTKVGTHPGTFAYFNDGSVRGHRIVGSTKQNLAKFDAGDVIGCGLNLTSKEIILTKNGERLGKKEQPYHRFISSHYGSELFDTNFFFASKDADDLYPAISLNNPGDEVEANFGPNFKYTLFT